ncbi:MAG: hypothetical protein ACK4M9_03910 [Anaerobacillus sp.]|uniref:hypothetical protein n=1 Tax=Anaerobacillus sp. TaxID=1872506 RepID=UPI003918BB96
MKATIKAKENQLIYLLLGIFLTGMGIYLNYVKILNWEFPDSIMLLALGVNQLMLAYLSPHLFPKDKRSKAIMGKAMVINYFVLFATILVLFLLTSSFGPLILDASQVLQLLFCVMVIAIPGTMVVYSRLI